MNAPVNHPRFRPEVRQRSRVLALTRGLEIPVEI